MPLAYKKRVRQESPDAESDSNPRVPQDKDTCDEITRYRFALRPYWFVLAQTDGEATFTPPMPGFDLATALRELRIEQVDFTSTNGNAQGYAFERSIAINPLAPLPHKTTFHELAHDVLGHTEEGQLDERTGHLLTRVEGILRLLPDALGVASVGEMDAAQAAIHDLEAMEMWQGAVSEPAPTEHRH